VSKDVSIYAWNQQAGLLLNSIPSGDSGCDYCYHISNGKHYTSLGLGSSLGYGSASLSNQNAQKEETSRAHEVVYFSVGAFDGSVTQAALLRSSGAEKNDSYQSMHEIIIYDVTASSFSEAESA
jgi:hypothetical protein